MGSSIQVHLFFFYLFDMHFDAEKISKIYGNDVALLALFYYFFIFVIFYFFYFNFFIFFILIFLF